MMSEYDKANYHNIIREMINATGIKNCCKKPSIIPGSGINLFSHITEQRKVCQTKRIFIKSHMETSKCENQ